MTCPVNIQFEEYDDPKLPYWMERGTSQPKLEHKLSKMFPVLGKRKVIIIEREGIKKEKKKSKENGLLGTHPRQNEKLFAAL